MYTHLIVNNPDYILKTGIGSFPDMSHHRTNIQIRNEPLPGAHFDLKFHNPQPKP
jgi:hypothetical protein